MATLLTMVNGLLSKLRLSDPVTTIVLTDPMIVALVGCLNDAAEEVLQDRTWDFDVRHDGRAEYPAKTSGTEGTFTQGSGYASIDFSYLTYANLVGPFRTHITIDNTAPRGDLQYTYLIDTAEPILGAGLLRHDIVLYQRYWEPSATGTLSWTTYSNEHILPTTVRRVLSVRHEDQPLKLQFIDREIDYDRMEPRPVDTVQDTSSLVMVGGSSENTSSEYYGVSPGLYPPAAATNGIVMMIDVVPEYRLYLDYTYVYRHAEMASDDDTLAHVPDVVVSIIESVALQKAYESEIKPDPQLASLLAVRNNSRIVRAWSQMHPQPLARNPAREYGAVPMQGYHSRWDSQTIP